MKKNRCYIIAEIGGNFTNFADAKKNVMNNLKKLDWSEGFYRKDIGHKVLK